MTKPESPHKICTEHSGLVGRLNLIIAFLLGIAMMLFHNNVNTNRAIHQLSELVHINTANIQSLMTADKTIQQQIGRIDRELERDRERKK